jgi:hypothetical protein
VCPTVYPRQYPLLQLSTIATPSRFHDLSITTDYDLLIDLQESFSTVTHKYRRLFPDRHGHDHPCKARYFQDVRQRLHQHRDSRSRTHTLSTTNTASPVFNTGNDIQQGPEHLFSSSLHVLLADDSLLKVLFSIAPVTINLPSSWPFPRDEVGTYYPSHQAHQYQCQK